MKWCNSFHETYRWNLYKYLALLLLLLAACDTYVEDKRSVDFEPIYLPDSEEEVRDMVRARAKATTQRMLDLSLDGRLGMKMKLNGISDLS